MVTTNDRALQGNGHCILALYMRYQFVKSRACTAIECARLVEGLTEMPQCLRCAGAPHSYIAPRIRNRADGWVDASFAVLAYELSRLFVWVGAYPSVEALGIGFELWRPVAED